MNQAKPTREEWNSLYQAEVDFKRSACWEWMYEDDIIGVVDPETRETAYCCIMGNGGEHFAVAGYLGTEGLSGILGLLSGEIDTESSESMFIQKCRNEWPLFRYHEPGFDLGFSVRPNAVF